MPADQTAAAVSRLLQSGLSLAATRVTRQAMGTLRCSPEKSGVCYCCSVIIALEPTQIQIMNLIAQILVGCEMSGTFSLLPSANGLTFPFIQLEI